jgi:hypothetical protein
MREGRSQELQELQNKIGIALRGADFLDAVFSVE